jgi:hypothetical protein
VSRTALEVRAHLGDAEADDDGGVLEVAS